MNNMMCVNKCGGCIGNKRIALLANRVTLSCLPPNHRKDRWRYHETHTHRQFQFDGDGDRNMNARRLQHHNICIYCIDCVKSSSTTTTNILMPRLERASATHFMRVCFWENRLRRQTMMMMHPHNAAQSFVKCTVCRRTESIALPPPPPVRPRQQQYCAMHARTKRLPRSRNCRKYTRTIHQHTARRISASSSSGNNIYNVHCALVHPPAHTTRATRCVTNIFIQLSQPPQCRISQRFARACA